MLEFLVLVNISYWMILKLIQVNKFIELILSHKNSHKLKRSDDQIVGFIPLGVKVNLFFHYQLLDIAYLGE